MSRKPTSANRERYHHNQMAALAEADTAAGAKVLGLDLTPEGQARLRFFERDYLVGREGVKAADGGEAGLDHQSVAAHYLMTGGQGELTGEFVPIGRLTGMVGTGASPSDSLLKPLEELFGDKYGAFAQAAEKIGGRQEGLAPSGAKSWLFQALPKLPMQALFFEADDEFPAEIKVLFDRSATNFVSYECLELLEIVLVEELLSAAGFDGEEYQRYFL